MKYLLLPAVLLIAVIAGILVFSIKASPAPPSIPHAVPPILAFETAAFEFPGAGERNSNRTIGDFCCTGETATVRASQGTPVGYIYFHDFDGGITNGSRSAAIQFGVLVSGVSDLARPNPVRVKSSIEFSSKELKPGLSRSAIAGALQFTATILDVQFVDEVHSRYWMDSVKVKVEVEQAPLAKSDQPPPNASTGGF